MQVNLKTQAIRWYSIAAWSIVLFLSLLRFVHLQADFPNYSPWMQDQAKFTDEGWWANAAVMHRLLGHWVVAGDYNPGVALPVWPALLAVLFHFTGVSLIAARAMTVVFSIATLGAVYFLVRRFTSAESELPALLAVVVMAASPFVFVFSRLAILETLVIFEFCALMGIACCASSKKLWPLIALPILITLTILTKTTVALLLPSVLWIAWNAMGRKPAALLRAIFVIGVIPALLTKGYEALVAKSGFSADYDYFFGVNGMPDIAWDQAIPTVFDLLRNCFWVDRILYPIGILILVLSLVWMRQLWRNPLFAASWLALAAQACFVFSRQDDYAPRYFLGMLAPLILVVVLTIDELSRKHNKIAAFFILAIAVSTAINAAMIVQFLTHPTFQFIDAAKSIQHIIENDPHQKRLIFGVSGSQISLMTCVPSINDAYGTEEMALKVQQYQPGWYLAWNSIAVENDALLAPFRLEQLASYPIFDDDDRNKLILYKMVRRPEPTPNH
jgi:hypothetical protein